MLNSLDQRTRVLLAVVFGLILARFAVVPLINWQNDQLAASRELNARIRKAERLMSSSEPGQTAIALGDQIEQLKVRYFSDLSELDLQLQLDKQIDSSLSMFNLRQERRAWRFEAAEYLTGEVRLSLAGSWPGIVQWVHYLENRQKFAEIGELRIVRSSANQINEVTANLVIRYRVLGEDV